MRVTIEIVPLGVEDAAHTIDVVEVWQVEAHDDDPGGMRTYETSDGRRLLHRRADGARTLAVQALL